ncbi:hypothetical protein D3C80_947660 [compost metagenome]
MLQNDDYASNVRALKSWKTKGGSGGGWIDRVLKSPIETELPTYTTAMNDITREELNALLENHQLKADARLKEFEGRVADGLLKMDHSLQLLDKDLSGVRGLKGTIILNSVLSVIAIVGITIAVMAYGVANFDSGRDTSAALQEMKQQSFETRQLLEQVKAQQKAPQAAQ